MGVGTAPTGALAKAMPASVEPYSIAWRAGLRWSDVLVTIKVFSTLHPGEVLKEHVVTDGYSAAKALRPATGMLELHIIRRPTTIEDAAAALLQAAWCGHQARWTMRMMAAATTADDGVLFVSYLLPQARGVRILRELVAAARLLGSASKYQLIFEHNRDQLHSPDDITPGMKLRIPGRDAG